MQTYDPNATLSLSRHLRVTAKWTTKKDEYHTGCKLTLRLGNGASFTEEMTRGDGAVPVAREHVWLLEEDVKEAGPLHLELKKPKGSAITPKEVLL